MTQLKTAGVKLVSLGTPNMHAKSIVVDGSRAYVGSANFSKGSLRHNREIGIIFTRPAEVQKVLSTTNADFGRGTAL